MATLNTEELGALHDAFERLLQDNCSEQHVRKWMEDRQGYDQHLWQAIADMGIAGLLVEEEFGGTEAGLVAVERMMELAGSSLLGAPLLASSVLATSALNACGDDDAKSRLLPDMAAGERIATLLITGPGGDWTPTSIALDAQKSDSGWSLEGSADFVLHGRSANTWLAVANTTDGPTLFEVDPGANGAQCTALPSFDHTMVLDRITMSSTPGQLIGRVGKGWNAIDAALQTGVVALAGEQAGGARRILDITVEYAKIRHQFGRPIGSFQAVKHMASDLVVEVESSISAARKAAATQNDADAATWRNLAAFACADAYTRTTADAVQMHGGIAFTWEHPAHLYLRRARANAQLLGNSNYFREQYLRTLGG